MASCSPYWVAKCLRVDVSLVYRVMQQYARTGNIYFASDQQSSFAINKKSARPIQIEADSKNRKTGVIKTGDPKLSNFASVQFSCRPGLTEDRSIRNPLISSKCDYRNGVIKYGFRECKASAKSARAYFRDEYSDDSCPPKTAKIFEKFSPREIVMKFVSRSSANLSKWITGILLPESIALIRQTHGVELALSSLR